MRTLSDSDSVDNRNPSDPSQEASSPGSDKAAPEQTKASPKRKNRLARKLLSRFGEDLFVFAQKRFMAMNPDKVERTGARLGMIHYLVDSKHRKRTAANLRMVFPDWSEDRVNQTVKEVFQHFGMVAGDFLRSPARSNQEVIDSVVEVEGIEHFEWSKSQSVGFILVTGHFGNWERFLQWLTINGAMLNVITRDPNQEGLQKRIADIREKTGAKVLSRGNSARQSLVCLRRRDPVGMLADQNSQDAMAPFFGFPAGTVLGPAVMHLRTGAPLLPAYCVRIGPNRYRVIFLPPVNQDRALDDRIEVTKELNLRLESVVREFPGQYLWMHDRWKAARRAGLLDGYAPGPARSQ